MSLPKFMAMLHTKSLFFSSVALFEDQYEWSVPAGWSTFFIHQLEQVKAERKTAQTRHEAAFQRIQNQPWEEMYKRYHSGKPSTPAELEKFKSHMLRDVMRGYLRTRAHDQTHEETKHRIREAEASRQISALVRFEYDAVIERDKGCVNCWFASEHQSIAMWDLYSSPEGGIAIQTTVGRLKEAIAKCKEDIYIGRVKYIDYAKPVQPNLSKHLSTLKQIWFEHEKEVRAVVYNESVDEGFSSLSIEIDLNRLVESAYIHPRVAAWAVPAIKATPPFYGFNIPLEQKDLLHRQK